MEYGNCKVRLTRQQYPLSEKRIHEIQAELHPEEALDDA